MTTLSGTPYGKTETGAVYSLVNLIALMEDDPDASGTSKTFCRSCEHDPCVAGFPGYCEKRPAFVVRRRLREEMLALIGEVSGPDNPLFFPLRTAVYGVADPAMFSRDRSTTHMAYADMVRLLVELREAKEALS